MDRVFVYGSLRRGGRAHALLAEGRFLGVTESVPGYTMLDLGAYPALVPGEDAIVGELYEASPGLIRRLDAYEGVPDLFVREKIALADGTEAWVYIFRNTHRREDWPRVRGSDWIESRSEG